MKKVVPKKSSWFLRTHITMNNLLMAYSAALRWQQAIHCWQGGQLNLLYNAFLGICACIVGAPKGVHVICLKFNVYES